MRDHRSSASLALGRGMLGAVLTAAACSGSPSAQSDVTHAPIDAVDDGTGASNAPEVAPLDIRSDLAPLDASVDPPPDVQPDALDDASTEASADVGFDAGFDAAFDAPASDVMDAGGRIPDAASGVFGIGYIRFLNLSRGAGSVRFIAVNQPRFKPTRVEIVVPEGESSGYIETSSVSIRVNAYPADAATDGGAGDAGFVAELLSDIYNRAGCTVVLLGSPLGSPTMQMHRRMVRVVDVPLQSDAGVAPVRLYNALVGVQSVDVHEGPARIIDGQNFADEASGFQLVAPGDHRLDVRDTDSRAALATGLPVRVLDRRAQTLFAWGEVAPGRAPYVQILLTDDVPPGR